MLEEKRVAKEDLEVLVFPAFVVVGEAVYLAD